MVRREVRLDPELLALLSPGKIERRAPPDVRARALAGARAIIAAGGRIPPVTVLKFPARRVAQRRVPVWIPVAASVVVAAATAVALRGRPSHAPPIASSQTTPLPVVALDQQLEAAPIGPPRPTAQPEVMPNPLQSARAGLGPRQHVDGPSLSAELDLLSRAQAAYTRDDFSRALASLAEHARRFPNGHLAEEREALRVRSLSRSGRTDESRRAASAFTLRFPRSVLMAHAEGQERSQ